MPLTLTPNKYVSELDNKGAILPSGEEIENKRCQCGKSHLLHYKKEPLCYYGGKIWSLWCAIRAEFDKANYQFSCATEEILNLKDQLQRNKEIVKQQKQFYRQWCMYAGHHEDCKVIELAEVGRICKDTDCNCGYCQANAAIEKYVLDEGQLNGRATDFESVR